MTLKQKPPKEKPPEQEPPKTFLPLWFWWLILIGLLIWNIVSFWPKMTPEVEIPYTTNAWTARRV